MNSSGKNPGLQLVAMQRLAKGGMELRKVGPTA